MFYFNLEACMVHACLAEIVDLFFKASLMCGDFAA